MLDRISLEEFCFALTSFLKRKCKRKVSLASTRFGEEPRWFYLKFMLEMKKKKKKKKPHLYFFILVSSLYQPRLRHQTCSRSLCCPCLDLPVVLPGLEGAFGRSCLGSGLGFVPDVMGTSLLLTTWAAGGLKPPLPPPHPNWEDWQV